LILKVAIDLNNNNVPDELESYLTANYVNKSDKTTLNDNELIRSLINGGYVATDFDKSTHQMFLLQVLISS
jgi:OOP family OmpA-OmpF porin